MRAFVFVLLTVIKVDDPVVDVEISPPAAITSGMTEANKIVLSINRYVLYLLYLTQAMATYVKRLNDLRKSSKDQINQLKKELKALRG